MNYTIKIIAVIAIIIGLMSMITGLQVIGGFYEPDYQYYLTLVSYNVIMGAISVIAGIYIWQMNKYAKIYAIVISTLHVLVLLSLLTLFKNIISDHSIGAMTFRSIV